MGQGDGIISKKYLQFELGNLSLNFKFCKKVLKEFYKYFRFLYMYIVYLYIFL